MSDKAVVQFSEGTVLFEEGASSSALYVIKSGQVEIRKGIHEFDVALERLGPGDFCGELALVNDQDRPVTAVAVKKTTALKVQSTHFESMVQSNPDIAVRMIKRLGQRLTEAQYRISNLMLRSTKGRLLHQLRAEAVRAGESDDLRGRAPIPEDLADALAMEVGEVKSRLNEFIDRELIKVDEDGYFEIVDPGGFDRFLSYLELDDRFEGAAE
ncbi:MAG: Crp/Fnr family transcriptional regulator [Bradymonadaceae bacterium]